MGLKTLTLIEHAQELIRVKNPAFSIEEIDEEDEATFAMLGRGESSAIFQFESPGMQNVLKEAKPGTIEDLVALNALYRPGPMRFIPQYIACKHGRQPITYADPELEEELKNTYGVIVYQEQVMKVAQIIAGYSHGSNGYSEADHEVKESPGNWKRKKEVRLGRSPWAGQGACDRNLRDARAVRQLWLQQEPCPCLLRDRLSDRIPEGEPSAEFWAANLTNEMSNPDKFSEYLQTVRAAEIEISPA